MNLPHEKELIFVPDFVPYFQYGMILGFFGLDRLGLEVLSPLVGEPGGRWLGHVYQETAFPSGRRSSRQR
jgi:hypothetical protein